MWVEYGDKESLFAGALLLAAALLLAILRAPVMANEAERLNQHANQVNRGEGVPADPRRAAELYRQAADLGSSKAQNNLGVLYQTGRGVPNDLATAVYWFQKAARQNNPLAIYNLAVAYDYGLGVPADRSRAVLWYREALAGGIPQAGERLDVLEKSTPSSSPPAPSPPSGRGTAGEPGATNGAGRARAVGLGEESATPPPGPADVWSAVLASIWSTASGAVVTLLYVLAALAVLAVIGLVASARRIPIGHRGLFVRLARRTNQELEEGWQFLFPHPAIHDVILIDTRVHSASLESAALTSDGVPLAIKLEIQHHVHDLRKYSDLDPEIRATNQSFLPILKEKFRAEISRNSIHSLLGDGELNNRKTLDSILREDLVELGLADFGVLITRVYVTNLVVTDEQMRKAISSAALERFKGDGAAARVKAVASRAEVLASAAASLKALVFKEGRHDMSFSEAYRFLDSVYVRERQLDEREILANLPQHAHAVLGGVMTFAAAPPAGGIGQPVGDISIGGQPRPNEDRKPSEARDSASATPPPPPAPSPPPTTAPVAPSSLDAPPTTAAPPPASAANPGDKQRWNVDRVLYRPGQPLTAAALFQLVADEVYRDGVVAAWESTALERLIQRLALSPEQSAAILMSTQEAFARGLLGESRAADPRTVYRLALQLVLSDGRIEDSERTLLEALQSILRIDAEGHKAVLAELARPVTTE